MPDPRTDDINIRDKHIPIPGSTVEQRASAPKFSKKLNELFLEIKKRDVPIYVMVEDAVAYEIRLNRKGNKLAFEYKQISEDRMEEFLNKKVDVYHRTHGLWLGLSQAAVSVAGAMVPGFGLVSRSAGQVVQGLVQGVNVGLQKTDERLTSRDHSHNAQHDHVYQMFNASKQEHGGLLQNGKSQHRELDATIEKLTQFLQTLFSRLYQG